MRDSISFPIFPDESSQEPSQKSSQFEDHPIDAPSPLKAIVVGAGISGITAAVLLPIKVPGLELVIYERESDLGGVWHQCRYPGVRCDIPSHVYQSTFAPSLEWSVNYAEGAEIQQYWSSVADQYNVRKLINFGHEVQSANWDDTRAKWILSLKHGEEIITDESDILITATGRFSHPTLPQYPGLDTYRGHLCHSSRWATEFDATGKSIAVIGNGASGLQILPQLQKIAGRIDHYARSPTWIAGTFGADDLDREKEIPAELKASFSDPEEYLRFRKGLETQFFTRFGSIMRESKRSQNSRQKFSDMMRDRLGDRTDLLQAIQPDFSPNCRRLTPGPGYLEALTQENVTYITSKIESFTLNGIRTADGVERIVDAIVCCTGSEKSFIPAFPIISHGVDLREAWKPGGIIGFPKTYLGFAAPDFPNLLFIHGPNSSGQSGTLPHSTENQITYIARVLRKVKTQGIRTISPTKDATEDFQAYCEDFFPKTVLSENCSSWFNGGIKGGRVLANWPGSGTHANIVRREPRWEDWEYTYRSHSKNRFAYFGNGWSQKDIEANAESAEDFTQTTTDMTPYLKLSSITGDLDLRGYHESWYDA